MLKDISCLLLVRWRVGSGVLERQSGEMERGSWERSGRFGEGNGSLPGWRTCCWLSVGLLERCNCSSVCASTDLQVKHRRVD